MEALKKMNMANELPLSLIESEILPRLPAKSIGRCMCVCKQWESFLSTPTFARMHPRTINDYKLLLLDGQYLRTLPLTDCSMITVPCNPYPDIYMVASLDGLVCLASREVPTKLVFWNPLTGAYRKLSHNPFYYYSSSTDAVGFYKDSANDYKLVYLLFGGDLGAYIYSHRLDTWREIDFPFIPWPSCCSWSPATFWGQCLYFTVSYETDYYTDNGSVIICFDVETETFRKIGFPPGPHDPSDYDGSLVLLNRSIHLCVSYTTTINEVWWKRGHLWRMEGDGWVKAADFSDPLDNEFTRQHICTASTGNWLAVLDQENNCFKKINTEGFTTQYHYFSSTDSWYRASRTIYVETLVSPIPST